jgi:hypothetical protein
MVTTAESIKVCPILADAAIHGLTARPNVVTLVNALSTVIYELKPKEHREVWNRLEPLIEQLPPMYEDIGDIMADLWEKYDCGKSFITVEGVLTK